MTLSRLTALTITTLAMALSGCASMAVQSYTAPGQHLTKYRTYQWASVDALATGDPRLDNNPFFDGRVRAAIDRELAARRLEKGAGDSVDLVVHYHASVSQDIDVRGIDPEYKYCEEENCGPYVYEAGTLLVEFVNARNQQLVWRGWARLGLEGVIDSQRAMEATVDEAVMRILRRLPGNF
jgi:Domain of unknown function (DUF4136)